MPISDALKIEGLCTHIGNFKLIDINFELPVGKVLAIVGASGSGKTLLLRCIAGLHSIDSGRILFKGGKINELTPDKRRVGFVFQNYALFPHLSSPLNLGFPLFVKGKRKKLVKDIALKIAEELDGLPNYMSRKPSELPEGMKQLIVLGREKLHAVDILLLDEPLSQLDKKIHIEMRVFLKKFIRELSKTTIVVSSNPEDAFALADYLAIMDNGKLIQYGRPIELYKNPIHPTVMEELSSQGLNRLFVEIKNGNVIPFDFTTNHEDGRYTMYFRPEEVRILNHGISCKIKELLFYDGTKNLAICELKNGSEVTILINKHFKKNEIIKFAPENPKFFKIKEIQQV